MATAIAATLLLHLLLAAWLLSLKLSAPPVAVEIAEIEWMPPLPPLLPPPPLEPMPFSSEPAQAPSILLPVPEAIPPPLMEYDWYGDARAVAGRLGGSTERRSFGKRPARDPPKLKSKPDGPPPLFEQPLPRVGTSVTTTEGETILWISDYCYISLSSTSLTMRDFHEARQGIRTCIIPLGKPEPRDDLFDHLKSPPSGQSPGAASQAIPRKDYFSNVSGENARCMVTPGSRGHARIVQIPRNHHYDVFQ